MSYKAHELIQENKRTKHPFLDLGNCSLVDSTLPKELFDLEWLTKLNLGDYYQVDNGNWKPSRNTGSINYLSEESLEPLNRLFHLQSLDLRNNSIKDISFLGKLIKLKHLGIKNNYLKDIQPLNKLNQLRSLNISSNQIEDISGIEKLTQLRYLDVSYNKIGNIRFLGKLIKLQSLLLSFNRITEFPDYILSALPSIENLYINDNPIKNIPEVHLGNMYTNALSNLQGYFASLQQGRQRNDEVKLIVVGNTTSGKTSLMRFMRDGIYKKTENSTHGIALTRWLISDILTPLRVNIWDFGGQEYYHATHRLFMDDHAVYVVVWEASTNKEEILLTDINLSNEFYQLPFEHFPYSYWLDSIRYYAPNSIILLVQNKTWLQTFEPEENLVNVAKAEPAPSYCFEPSYSVHRPDFHINVHQADTYRNDPKNRAWTSFQDFRAGLISALQTSAESYELGKGWIAIRDTIRQMSETKYWVYYDEFEQLCKQIVTVTKLDFNASTEMGGLLTYLGGATSTILYYADDVRLRNIIFLNPQWVTDTIYDILTNDIRERYNNPGEFTRQHVERVLYTKNIGELTDTFLNLMKKDRFELIFEKPSCPDEFIAPQYLPNTHDDKDVQRYRRKTQHIFTLQFPRFMPRSVFLRFMVRYGNLATDVYWKYGIVLEKSNKDILVECLFSERKIRVAFEADTKISFAQELFDGLWRLCDRKSDIEVSVNELDFIEIGDFLNYSNDPEINKIKSKQGNLVYIKDFLHLLKLLRNEPKKLTIEMPDPKISEIYFSYAWGDAAEAGESREKFVDELYESLKNDGHHVFRDKMDLGYRGLISTFMDRIGKGDIVIVVISDKYLKSPYCMFELLEIYRNSKFTKEQFAKVIFPIRVESLALNKASVQSSYYDYWENEEKDWKQLVNKHRVSKAQTETYDMVRKIHNELGDLLGHLSDINSLTKELLSSNNFDSMKEAIKVRMKELEV